MIAGPNSPHILFTSNIQVLNASAEEQQSQNDILQEFQPRHSGSHLTRVGPTFSSRINSNAEGLPALFPCPAQCSSPLKAPHKQVTASSSTKLHPPRKQLPKTSKAALLVILILLGRRQQHMAYFEQPGLWRPKNYLNSKCSSQRLPNLRKAWLESSGFAECMWICFQQEGWPKDWSLCRCQGGVLKGDPASTAATAAVTTAPSGSGLQKKLPSTELIARCKNLVKETAIRLKASKV